MFSAADVVLSAYQNPPYRAPTPRNQPQNGPSPKRKRASPGMSPLQLDTQHYVESSSPSGSSSPRSKVADRLKDLDLRPVHHFPARVSERSGSPHKRAKHDFGPSSSTEGGAVSDSSRDAGSSENVRESPASTASVRSLPPTPREQNSPEVGETPDTRLQKQSSSSPQPRTTVGNTPLATACGSALTNEDDSRSVARPDRSVSPLPTALAEGNVRDQAALTWHEDEITGHDIDPGGDDDGEGINGIGFKPTAAIAYARQQRRRQQVSDWRAREAREARQRRIERRRGAGRASGPVSKAKYAEAITRVVRFAEVG